MATRSRVGRARHLVRRFLGSLRPGGVRAADVEWVRVTLTDVEFGVWQRLGRADSRESVVVARATERALAGTEFEGDTRWVAAALLHDVGKLDAGLGTYGRAV